jgi:hypothetical protein
MSTLNPNLYGANPPGAGSMKITVNVDCTPDEARHFFGLPDVKPMQDALMQQIQDRMSANLQAMEPEAMLKTWLPAGMQGFEQMQKMFWSQMANAMGKDGKK